MTVKKVVTDKLSIFIGNYSRTKRKEDAEYIQNQLKEDQASEQRTMKENIDPFDEEGKK